MFAPASSTRSGRFGFLFGITVAIAGRFTPGMRPSVSIALVATAPELPADTKASARPSFTRRIATLMEQSFFFLTASTGDSSISATSGAWTISRRPRSIAVWADFFRSFSSLPSSSWMGASCPTRRIFTFGMPTAASTAPTTISPGA